MWMILGPVMAAVVGVILIVIRMAYLQRVQDRQATERGKGKQDSAAGNLPVFMIGFTDKK